MKHSALSAAAADLSLDLLRGTASHPNRMISALSLCAALAMLAEGAEGRTLRELEKAIGLPIGDLREALSAFLAEAQAEGETAFRSANSLWVEERGFSLNEDYAARLRADYRADITPVAFAAADTAHRINGWVSSATDGMIDRLVDENTLRGLTALLINALCFDAKWERTFADRTDPAPFTRPDGSTVTAEFMQSKCESLLIEHEGAQGFIKRYAGGDFSFAALLPPEGVTVEKYLAKMQGEDFTAALDTAREWDSLRVRIPAFAADCSMVLNDTLRDLGIKRIFSPAKAQLSGIGQAEGSLYVDTVLQKTHIEVNTEGTRAAAVTAIMVKAMSMMPPLEYREIVFDRPFLYAILDNRTKLPLFMGIMEDPSAEK